MRWSVFFFGIPASFFSALILSDYVGSLLYIDSNAAFWLLFTMGIAGVVVAGFKLTDHAMSFWDKWVPRICLVLAYMWVRQIIGLLFDAPLFVTATDYSLTPPRTATYLIYSLGDSYQMARAARFDLPLILMVIVTLAGIAPGETWTKRIIYGTAVAYLLVSVFGLAFPGAYDQAAGILGQPKTHAGRLTKQAFEQSFQQRIALKEAYLQTLLDRGKPVAPGSPAPVLAVDHWQKIAALKKEMETMKEDHLKEGKRLFPDLYEKNGGEKWQMCWRGNCWKVYGESITPAAGTFKVHPVIQGWSSGEQYFFWGPKESYWGATNDLRKGTLRVVKVSDKEYALHVGGIGAKNSNTVSLELK